MKIGRVSKQKFESFEKKGEKIEKKKTKERRKIRNVLWGKN